jgi:hypothetical protein
VIYILEGQLPIALIIRGESRSFKAPHICLTQDSLEFIEYERALKVRGMSPEERMCLHTMYFHIEWQRAFESISKTFLNGYFRAAIYLTEIYLEVGTRARDFDAHCDRYGHIWYWWDPVRFLWQSIGYGRFNPAIMHKHYLEMRELGRLAL